MATERIDIVISERGSRVVKRNIEEIGSSAERTVGPVNLLNRALGALGGTLAARELLRLADTYTTIQNRLRTVTQGTAQLSVVTGELFNISNRTRQSFESTAELYSRLGLAAKSLGTSQQELLNFTESLNQAVALSGAKAAEASNAIVQLSQGLASGALQGDELRSVLEQLPAVADVITSSLGIQRGELRKLGAEGKITADVVLKAFREARVELAEKFANSVPTVESAFVVLRNRVTQLVGEFDTGAGFSRLLAESLLFLAANLDLLVRAATAAAFAFSVVLVGRGLALAIAGVQALGAAVIANPLGLLVTAVGAVVSTLIAFSDKITVGAGRLATLRDLGLAVFENISGAVGSFISTFQSQFGGILTTAQNAFGGINLSVSSVLSFSANSVDTFIGIWVGAFRAILAAFSGLPAALQDIFTRALNGAIAIVEAGVNKIATALSSVTEFVGAGKIGTVNLGRLENNAAGSAENLGKAVKGGFLSGLDEKFIGGALERTLARADTLAQERNAANQAQQSILAQAKIDLGQGGNPGQAGGQAAPRAGGIGGAASGLGEATPNFEFLISQLQREGEALQSNNQQREVQQQLLQFESELKRTLTADETALVTAQLAVNQGLSDQALLYDQINAPIENYGRQLQALDALLEQGKISLEQYKTKLAEVQVKFLETQNTIGAGLGRALTKVSQDLGNAAQQIENLVTNAFQKAEDALVGFVKTGKLDFKGLVDSILTDLIRLTIRQGILGPIASALGGIFGGGAGGGGLGSALGGLFGFQNGGDFVVGGSGGIDSQLIAFRATPGEQVIVNRPQDDTQQKDRSSSSQNIVFNISTPTPETFRESEAQIASRVARLVGRGRRNL